MKSLSTILVFLIVATIVLNTTKLSIELQFENPSSNYLFVMMLCILLPLSILLWGILAKTKNRKIAGIILSVLIAFPSGIIYFFVSSNYENVLSTGIDSSFEKIDEVTVGDSWYKLYRTNGGATTAYGLVLRKENKLFLGIKTVENIYSKYKAYESTLKVLSQNELLMIIKPYSKRDKFERVRIKI
ncbi:MAG: hypothetical protein COA86_00685 [Kangiella sp.]|nr:MAG: hypothetical protein COA86_00685 [Kangiella sp.]